MAPKDKDSTQKKIYDPDKEIERLNQSLAAIQNSTDSWKNKIISLVSHEFRTPLATIKLTVSYLMKYRNKMDADAIDEKLAVIVQQADNLVHSVDNLVNQKAADETKIRLSRKSLDLLAFFEKLKLETENKFKKHSVLFTHGITTKVTHTDSE